MTTVATRSTPRGTIVLDADRCKGCELCIPVCPPRVLDMSTAGAWPRPNSPPQNGSALNMPPGR